jgi:hypothetical protein
MGFFCCLISNAENKRYCKYSYNNPGRNHLSFAARFLEGCGALKQVPSGKQKYYMMKKHKYEYSTKLWTEVYFGPAIH